MRRALTATLALIALVGCVTPSLTGSEAARPAPRGTTRPLAGPGGPLTAPGGPPTGTPAPVGLTPLTPAASIIGKLKAGPASLIANNSAALLGDRGGGVLSNQGGALVANHGAGLAGTFRLLGLEEAPLAGAQVRLVDAAGQPLTAEVATTDAAGGFTLGRPEGLAEALVQATFTAADQPIEYLAALPASGPLEVDTASTLAAARWRLNLQAGRTARPPGPGLLARLRLLLEPGRVPFMGRGSRDVADAFDQLVADDEALRQAVVSETPALSAPARPWRVEPWHTSEALQAAGALPADGRIARGEVSVFAIDGGGQLHMVVNGTPSRIVRVTAAMQVETVAEVPADATGPYSITFSPSKRLFLVHGTRGEGLAVARVEANGTLTRIFEMPPSGIDLPDNAPGRLAASDAGEVYMTSVRHHGILVARPGTTRLALYAGRIQQAGHRDGPRTEALFNTPRALAVAPDGRLYVADKKNHCIRRVEPDGTVVTVAGKPGETAARFGRGAFSRLGEPGAIVVARDGTMFATDMGGPGAIVLRLSPQGSVFHVAGGPTRGVENGPGPEARFIRPANMELDDAGNLYLEDIASFDGSRYIFTLRKLVPPTP
ncbi:MAG: hypothetical protein VKQ33_01385 [Candidatus Sericytochromatia bacterium]|nr:hypothetical protein [Candidatus Sericytochromatia bacterium]